MLNLIINLLIINISCLIFIWSGFPDTIKKIWFKIRYPKRAYNYITLKPFDCPLCLTFWTTLIFLYLTNGFSLIIIFYSLLNSFLATILYPILEIVSLAYYQLTVKIKKYLEKL